MQGNGVHKKGLTFEAITTWVGSLSSLLLHTGAFIAAFIVAILGYAEWDTVLLVLTTAVSLEAIYLAIFIQMTVNRHQKELQEVSEDVEDIQEDIEDISEDVEDLGKDVEDIQENIEDMSEEEQSELQAEEERKNRQLSTMEQLSNDVRRVLEDLEALKKEQK